MDCVKRLMQSWGAGGRVTRILLLFASLRSPLTSWFPTPELLASSFSRGPSYFPPPLRLSSFLSSPRSSLAPANCNPGGKSPKSILPPQLPGPIGSLPRCSTWPSQSTDWPMASSIFVWLCLRHPAVEGKGVRESERARKPGWRAYEKPLQVPHLRHPGWGLPRSALWTSVGGRLLLSLPCLPLSSLPSLEVSCIPPPRSSQWA